MDYKVLLQPYRFLIVAALGEREASAKELMKKLPDIPQAAMTEQEEFATIYDLDIIEIPTNRPNIRLDHSDVVYKTTAGKYRAVINNIKECHEKGQPVLVGTVSIEKNETLSKLLAKEGIKHNLLNAKNHEKEAEIIAQAGKLGAVTIATNMQYPPSSSHCGTAEHRAACSSYHSRGFPPITWSATQR